MRSLVPTIRVWGARKFLRALSLFLLFAGNAGADDKKAAVQPIQVVTLNRKEPVSYDRDIEPILLNKCQTCHSGSVKEGKLDMGSYEQLLKGGKRGRPIVTGKSSESLLVLFAGKTKKPFMPPKSEEPLTPQELALIKLWIDQGAKAPTGKRERPRIIVGVPPASVHPVRALVISPDKSALVAARGTKIDVYDAGSGTHIRTLLDPQLQAADGNTVSAAHLSIVDSLAVSADGRWIASGAFQEVKLWDTQTGTLRKRLTGFVDRVVALAFSPNGKWLATGGGAPSQDGEIKIIEVATGNVVADIAGGHSDQVFGVRFSPDSKKLATCGADKFVKVFEAPAGKFIKAFEGHTHHVLDVAWNADGKQLVSAGADNVIKVWDYEKGEQLRTFGNHAKQITRLVFKGKTPEIATCSGDQTVRIWNIDNGGNTMTFGGSNDFLYTVDMTADGKLLAAGGEEGIVRLYNATNGQLIKALVPPGIEVKK
jgi:Planctomycete cytochrome C/WD domain, G-beta repeat